MAIFSPSFILVALFGPLLQKIRQMPAARGALDGMNAAVVGLMLVVAVRLTAAAVWQSDARRMGWVSAALLVMSLIGAVAQDQHDLDHPCRRHHRLDHFLASGWIAHATQPMPGL